MIAVAPVEIRALASGVQKCTPFLFHTVFNRWRLTAASGIFISKEVRKNGTEYL